MKCEVCQELLEEYVDGELPAQDQEQISAHLMTCADCSAGFAALTAEQEMFSRYDREVEVPPFLWTRIAQHTVARKNPMSVGWRARLAGLIARPANAVAIVLIASAAGLLYWNTNPTLPRNGTDLTQAEDKHRNSNADRVGSEPQRGSVGSPLPNAATPQQKPEPIASTPRRKHKIKTTTTIDQSDVLSSDLGYLDIDDRDTAKHIEQSQLLLRSIRNVPVTDGDEEIDVSYDKALSRRLLNENVVLRREAEMKAKFPTKSLLADLEPLLIDIANLPDQARAEDVRAIKDRVQQTEIVAALMGYQDRSPNNR